MNISEAAQHSGLSAKALRYYESIDLLSPGRAQNGYRDYSDADLEILRFIQRARATGFSVDEVRELLSLYRDPARHSRDAKALVEDKLGHIETQLRSLREMQQTLRGLAERCAGDESPQCAILEGLSHHAAK
ncbi:MerR family transcriptional regulator [Microbulbifer hainanensis]|uniref:MerR family transcriptional regulator n=1 Tax=Microbulbifer hainanensis TaxID=2735675 RepID=UPI00186657B6|nr:MerR family transcriptional regulator [Microbulbifer hainanensis]